VQTCRSANLQMCRHADLQKCRKMMRVHERSGCLYKRTPNVAESRRIRILQRPLRI
jgi:hypothetical protein